MITEKWEEISTNFMQNSYCNATFKEFWIAI